MRAINRIRGLDVLNPRGNPSMATEVRFASGARVQAAAPAGANIGSREAIELRDGDTKRPGGKGVRNTVGPVNAEIAHALCGLPLRIKPPWTRA